MFFEGSVAEAIAASRGQRCPLIVLLTGFDQDSREVQDQLMELEQQPFVRDSVVLVLEDDLDNLDASQFTDAKNLRAFCPVEHLPTVVMVSPAGGTLAKVVGVTAAGELGQQLAAGFEAFSREQERLSAARALISGGGAPPPHAAAAAGAGATQSAAMASQPAVDLPAAGAGAATAAERAAGAAGGAAGTGQGEGDAGTAQPAAETVAAAQEEAQQADAASVPFRLQFKFTDCSVLRGDFSGSSSLADVFGWIDRERAATGTCRGLAYIMVQAAPRLVLGAAQEGQSLVEAGLQPRTSLQVIPHSAQGHRPPPPPALQPPPAPEIDAAVVEVDVEQQATQQAGQQQQVAAAVAMASSLAAEAAIASTADVLSQLQEVRSAAAAVSAGAGRRSRQPTAKLQAAPPLPPPPPTELLLQVRLTNGQVLRRMFAPESQLSQVLDWVDEQRTDRGAYKLVQRFPKPADYFSGDLGKSLLELGFEARTSLQLMPAGSKAKPNRKAPTADASPLNSFQLTSAQLAAAQQQAYAAAATHQPGVYFTLQFKLTNGEQLRGIFPADATLQEVCHYLDTHRTDGAVQYTLVQPYPRRSFSPEDMPCSLQSLGLQQRTLLLLEPLAQTGSGWSLRSTLGAAAGFINPLRFLRGGAAGTARDQSTAVQEDQAGQQQARQQQQRGVATDTLPSGDSSQQQRGARKRAVGGRSSGAGGSGSGGSSGGGGGVGNNVYTLSSSSRDDTRDDPQNKYSNGNSTVYDGLPPPGQPPDQQ